MKSHDFTSGTLAQSARAQPGGRITRWQRHDTANDHGIARSRALNISVFVCAGTRTQSESSSFRAEAQRRLECSVPPSHRAATRPALSQTPACDRHQLRPSAYGLLSHCRPASSQAREAPLSMPPIPLRLRVALSASHEHADAAHAVGRLRARCKRPRGRAAEQRDERRRFVARCLPCFPPKG